MFYEGWTFERNIYQNDIGFDTFFVKSVVIGTVEGMKAWRLGTFSLLASFVYRFSVCSFALYETLLF